MQGQKSNLLPAMTVFFKRRRILKKAIPNLYSEMAVFPKTNLSKAVLKGKETKPVGLLRYLP